jgi:hypothetical protein
MDEDGTVQGLPEEVVEERTLALHNIVDYSEFRAGVGKCICLAIPDI